MSKQTIIAVLIAIFPSYSSLFCKEGTLAALIICITTFVGFVLTNLVSEEPQTMDKVRLGWIIHIIGVLVVITFFNI
jgi:hypothetical protein